MKGGKVFMSKIKTCLKCYKVKTSRLKMKLKRKLYGVEKQLNPAALFVYGKQNYRK